MSDPLVSVVIVSYNSRHDLEECLPSLYEQDYNSFEIIVIDNHSTDDTIDYLEQHFPSKKMIKNPDNYGFAKACNQGISASEAKYIVLINPDTLADRTWLSELVNTMENDGNIAACQSSVLLYNNPDTINTEGNDINYLGFAWCRNYGMRTNPGKGIQETVGLSNCSTIFRRDILQQIGLLDEDFFMYVEDTDLGLRIQLNGYKVVCNPNSILFHKYAYKQGKRKMFLLERNRLLMLLKVYDKLTLAKIIPVFIFMEVGLLGYSLFRGWFGEKIESYIWIIANWKLVKSKRQNVTRSKPEIRRILDMMNSGVTFEELSNPLLDKFVNPVLRAYYRLVLQP